MIQRGLSLIVDADTPSRCTLAAQFERLGWEVQCYSAVAEALAFADRHPPDLVVTEMRWADCIESNSLALIKQLARRVPSVEIAVVTDYPSIATAMLAARMGAAIYLNKPANAAFILAAVSDQETTASHVRREAGPMSLERVEWEYVCHILRSCDFNRSKAARLLGIGRRTLQRKLEARPPLR